MTCRLLGSSRTYPHPQTDLKQYELHTWQYWNYIWKKNLVFYSAVLHKLLWIIKLTLVFSPLQSLLIKWRDLPSRLTSMWAVHTSAQWAAAVSQSFWSCTFFLCPTSWFDSAWSIKQDIKHRYQTNGRFLFRRTLRSCRILMTFWKVVGSIAEISGQKQWKVSRVMQSMLLLMPRMWSYTHPSVVVSFPCVHVFCVCRTSPRSSCLVTWENWTRTTSAWSWRRRVEPITTLKWSSASATVHWKGWGRGVGVGVVWVGWGGWVGVGSVVAELLLLGQRARQGVCGGGGSVIGTVRSRQWPHS